MKLVLLLSMLSCITISFAAQAIKPRDSDRPGVCIYGEKELHQGSHSSWPGKCQRVICTDDGTIVFHSCGSISLWKDNCTAGCYLNIELPYPSCCRRYYHCVGENGERTILQL